MIAPEWDAVTGGYTEDVALALTAVGTEIDAIRQALDARHRHLDGECDTHGQQGSRSAFRTSRKPSIGRARDPI